MLQLMKVILCPCCSALALPLDIRCVTAWQAQEIAQAFGSRTPPANDCKQVSVQAEMMLALQITELAQLAGELQQLNLPPPLVGETFDFADAPSALRRLQTGKTVGKVVLEVDSP